MRGDASNNQGDTTDNQNASANSDGNTPINQGGDDTPSPVSREGAGGSSDVDQSLSGNRDPIDKTGAPPVAVDDDAFEHLLPGFLNYFGLDVTAGRSLDIAPSRLLGNDSDPENDALTIIGVSTPANSGASTNIDLLGNITYTAYPSNGLFSDTFDYTVSDGTNTETATVTLMIHDQIGTVWCGWGHPFSC